MKNKNILIGIAVACLLLAVVITVKTLTGQDDAAVGQRMYLNARNAAIQLRCLQTLAFSGLPCGHDRIITSRKINKEIVGSSD